MIKLLRDISDLLLGKKYYANIVLVKGTDRMEMTSFIHKTRKQAKAHRMQIESTATFLFVETISFRSYEDY